MHSLLWAKCTAEEIAACSLAAYLHDYLPSLSLFDLYLFPPIEQRFFSNNRPLSFHQVNDYGGGVIEYSKA